MRPLLTLAPLGLTLALLSAGSAQEGGPPYSPEQSMATMRIADGFRVDLVASEPDVQSPVALDIDENGRMFVVEMPGYPLDTSPTGRVKLLEDRDGDGRFERSSVFADSLVLPTGVMRWKKGVLVTAAPDVLYLEDADDDGRAERRTVVLTGFPFTNPQHTVNAPIYGLDNWIYVANQGPVGAVIYKDLFGDRGSLLTFPAQPGRPGVDPHDSSVRFRPDTFEVEAIAGESQFGHSFDAYGRYFGNDNSHHLWHEVIAARYLRRNPDLLTGRVMHDVPDHGAAAAVFPITRSPTFELLTEAGEFTSACAPTVYLGGAFPAAYEGSVFVAEPVHNLVHRDVLVPAGPTFAARRGEEQREFLAAGDAWFRPVNFYVGPEGALYLVDYYRGRIEHPEWTSSDAQRDPATLHEGRERGRIYRIVHRSTDGRAPRRPQLGRASIPELVSALDEPNVWWRRTAQRLLVDRRDRPAIPLLEALAGAAAHGAGRLHALWTLHALGVLNADLLAPVLEDPDPGLRENAVVLAELNGSLDRFANELERLSSDPDPRVRFQVLAALGSGSTPAAVAAHKRLLFAELEDPWMQLAGLSAESSRAPRLLARALSGREAITSRYTESRALFVRRLASMVGARAHSEEIASLISLVVAPHAEPSAVRESEAWWRAAALAGLADGVAGRDAAEKAVEGSREALLTLADHQSGDVRTGAVRLLALTGGPGSGPVAVRALAAAERHARDAGTDPERRADAIDLLGIAREPGRTALFESLVHPSQPEGVQAAAVKALGREPGPSVGRFLLERWIELTSAVRSEAANALLKDPARTRLLVEALEEGRVQPWMLNFSQKRDLLMNRRTDIRAAARAVLEEDPGAREQTARRYAAALNDAGDAMRGRAVFERACAACHTMGGTEGGDLGPDLATVRHRPAPLLLADILWPSQAIAQKYETYVVERTSGGEQAGILGAQTPTAITLRKGPGQEITIARREIRRLVATSQSTMPADLDKGITPEEMADLIAYIKRSASERRP